MSKSERVHHCFENEKLKSPTQKQILTHKT